MIEPGQRFGNYQIEQHLGSGAFATVWFARDVMLDAPVAIKVLADNWARDPEIRDRFIHEAKLLRRIDDDHVVRVFTVGELPDGRPFFVMAFADRGTLHDRVEARGAGTPWPLDGALSVVVDVLACLEVVHDLGAVHRDLKPSNVLFRSVSEHVSRRLGRSERMVLGDFGLAKDLVRASGFTVAAGTPAYMAPEQTRSTTQLDHRADLFSVTAMLFELLVGRPPVDATTVSDRRRARWSADELRLQQLTDRLPPAVVDVLRCGLAEQPVDRYSSAAEMRAVLASVLASEPSPAGAGNVPGGLAPPAWSPPGSAPRHRPGGLRHRVELIADKLHAAATGIVQEELGRPFTVSVVGGGGVGTSLASQLADVLPPVDATVEGVAPSLDDAVTSPLAAALPDAVVVVAGHEPDVGKADLDIVVDWLRAHAVAPVLLMLAVDGDGAESASRYRASSVAALVAGVAPASDLGALAGLVERATRRFDAVRASSALTRMTAPAQPAPTPLTPALLDDIDDLRATHPALIEMQVVRDEVLGHLPLPGPLRRTLREVLLLGRPDGASTAGDSVKQETESELATWRSYQNSGRASFATRNAVEVVITALERRWSTG